MYGKNKHNLCHHVNILTSIHWYLIVALYIRCDECGICVCRSWCCQLSATMSWATLRSLLLLWYSVSSLHWQLSYLVSPRPAVFTLPCSATLSQHQWGEKYTHTYRHYWTVLSIHIWIFIYKTHTVTMAMLWVHLSRGLTAATALSGWMALITWTE